MVTSGIEPRPDNTVEPPPAAGTFSAMGIALPAAAFLLLYVVISLITSALSGLSLSWLICSAVLALTLALLSAIDLKTFRLPDALTLPLAASGLVLPWILGDSITLLERSLAAAGAFAVIFGIDLLYQHLRGRQGMGLGDAKLFAAAGSWLGVEPLSHVLLWATASALAAVAVTAVRGGTLTKETRIAFGPFLAFGFWMAWINAT